MDEERWKRVESLFHQALVLKGEDRERFLAGAGHDDQSLLLEVKSLLAHYREEDPLLEDARGPRLASEPQLVLKEGDSIGNYEVISLLGKGGMGEVYLARDPRLRRKVAVKILPRSLAGDPELIARLRREAQTASALNHPNILTIYEFGRQDDLQYIVSEFVEGVSLRQYIGTLAVERALDYARQIGLALEAAHAVGVVHRDIKPENVMVRADGIVKVLDFGLAKFSDRQLETGGFLEQVTRGAGSTIPGFLVGTINYMSPEQVRGQLTDQRTDIWSWGVTLYEMLTGRCPFEAPTPGDALAAILNTDPVPPGHDRELNALVARALSKGLEQRYQRMEQALADLEKSRQQPPPLHISRFPRALPRTSQALLKIGLMVLLFVVAG